MQSTKTSLPTNSIFCYLHTQAMTRRSFLSRSVITRYLLPSLVAILLRTQISMPSIPIPIHTHVALDCPQIFELEPAGNEPEHKPCATMPAT
jgi:hypothetical protein